MNADFFKDNQHYVNISECLKQSTLFEAYRKTSKQDCQFFFVLLWAKLTNQITKKDFNYDFLEGFEAKIKKDPLKREDLFTLTFRCYFSNLSKPLHILLFYLQLPIPATSFSLFQSPQAFLQVLHCDKY